MSRLGVVREVVPEHVGGLAPGLRVTLLRAVASVSSEQTEKAPRDSLDETRELGRVAEEEDGSVVYATPPSAHVYREQQRHRVLL